MKSSQLISDNFCTKQVQIAYLILRIQPTLSQSRSTPTPHDQGTSDVTGTTRAHQSPSRVVQPLTQGSFYLPFFLCDPGLNQILSIKINSNNEAITILPNRANPGPLVTHHPASRRKRRQNHLHRSRAKHHPSRQTVPLRPQPRRAGPRQRMGHSHKPNAHFSRV